MYGWSFEYIVNDFMGQDKYIFSSSFHGEDNVNVVDLETKEVKKLVKEDESNQDTYELMQVFEDTVYMRKSCANELTKIVACNGDGVDWTTIAQSTLPTSPSHPLHIFADYL